MEIATNIKPNTCQNAIEISNSTQLQPMKAVRGPSSGLEAREEEGVKTSAHGGDEIRLRVRIHKHEDFSRSTHVWWWCRPCGSATAMMVAPAMTMSTTTMITSPAPSSPSRTRRGGTSWSSARPSSWNGRPPIPPPAMLQQEGAR